MGAVETLIVHENLDILRYELRNSDLKTVVVHATKDQAEDRSILIEKETGVEMEIFSSEPFIDWIAERYKDYGTTLEFVTDKSPEGAQFVKGFGGIGGILRYKVDLQQIGEYDEYEYTTDEDL